MTPLHPPYPNRSQAASGARVNALSTCFLSPPPGIDDSHSHEVCPQHHRNNNNSTHTFALLDSGSSVNTVPHERLLTTSHSSSGSSITAANGSSVLSIDSGSYSLVPNLTLDDTLITPSIDSPIISVSSLTHKNNKIVILSSLILFLLSFLLIQ